MNTQKRKLLALGFALIMTTVLSTGFIKAESNDERSTVSRSFSTRLASKGEIITVSLDVVIRNDDTFYILEEYVPVGWTVINANGGQCSPANRLCWVVISNAIDTTYTYTVQAPLSIGSYTFDGVYIFEGFSLGTTTLGNTSVDIVDLFPECDADQDGFPAKNEFCKKR